MVTIAEHGETVVDAARREQTTDLLRALAVRETALAEAHAQLVDMGQLVAAAREEAAEAARELVAIRATVSWRVTAPLRAVRRTTGRGRR